MMVIDFSAVVFSYAEPTAAEIRTTSDIVCSAGGAVMFKLNVVRLPLAVVGFAGFGSPPPPFGPLGDHEIGYVTAPVGPPPLVRVLALPWLRAQAFGPGIVPKIGPSAAAGAA